MSSTLRSVFLAQIDEFLADFALITDLSDIDDSELKALYVRGLALVHRASSENSVYVVEAENTKLASAHDERKLIYLVGVVKALRKDIDGGYLERVQSLVQAGVFADFLDMAEYLLAEGYKDAAAVMIGSVLEEHLRALCVKHQIDITFADSKGGIKPKKADALNSDLAAAGVISKIDQKSITSWLGLRNDAAHGNYSSYSVQQVQLTLLGVQDLLTRIPA